MTRLLLILFTLTAASFQGCGAEPAARTPSRPNLEKWEIAFRQANKIELHSILSSSDGHGNLPKIQGYPITGSTIIADAAEKEKLYSLLEEFIYDVPEKPFPNEPCKFSPHHAISITDDVDTHKILICFTCGQVQTLSKTLPTHFGSVGLSKGANRELDSMFKVHGVETSDEYYARQKGK